MPDTENTKDKAIDEARRLAGSAFFARIKASRDLLVHLAEMKAAGKASDITEYSIAMDLLGRDETFDPTTDPIVRVRTRRLREALDKFYAEEGDADGRLVLPKGSYVLLWTPAAQPAVEPVLSEVPLPGPDMMPSALPRVSRPRGLASLLGLLALLVLLAAYLGWSLYTERERGPAIVADRIYPLVAIWPLSNLTGDPDNDVYEKAFQRQLASDFQRFGRARVFVVNHDMTEKAPTADYVMRGAILEVEERVDLLIVMMDGRTGEPLMNRRLTRAADQNDYFTTLRDLSREVSGNIASQGGVLSQIEAGIIDANLGLPSRDRLDVFRCVALTDQFLGSYAPEEFLAAQGCFERMLGAFDHDPVASAAWGTLQLHAVPEYRFIDTSLLPERVHAEAADVSAYANGLADRFPNSDAAFILLGALYNARGETTQAIEALRRATELNPANPTARAVLAYALMADDRHAEALAEARLAVRFSAEPPTFMYVPILVAGLVQNDLAVLREAEAGYGDQPLREFNAPLLLAAAMRTGNTAQVADYKAFVLEMPDALAPVRSFVQGPVGLGAIENALREAGIPIR